MLATATTGVLTSYLSSAPLPVGVGSSVTRALGREVVVVAPNVLPAEGGLVGHRHALVEPLPWNDGHLATDAEAGALDVSVPTGVGGLYEVSRQDRVLARGAPTGASRPGDVTRQPGRPTTSVSEIPTGCHGGADAAQAVQATVAGGSGVAPAADLQSSAAGGAVSGLNNPRAACWPGRLHHGEGQAAVVRLVHRCS